MHVTISGDFLTVGEVAKLADLQPISVYSAIRRNTLRAIKIGKTLLICKGEINAGWQTGDGHERDGDPKARP